MCQNELLAVIAAFKRGLSGIHKIGHSVCDEDGRLLQF